MSVLDLVAKTFQRLLGEQSSERIDRKFMQLDHKVDHLDQRMDRLAISQAEQNEKLSAIHQVTLANNEALEQKINMNNASSQNAKDIAEIRFAGFSDSFKRLEDLVMQVIRRDCNPP
jgi:DNA uptake protein ComE-like DNA-binding protein